MTKDSLTELDEVLETLRNTAVSESSMRAALDRAKQIEHTNVERPGIGSLSSAGPLLSLRPTRLGKAAVAICAAAALAILLISLNQSIAYAQIPKFLDAIERVHLVIRSADSPTPAIEIWFERGTGLAMHTPLGIEIDDGKNYWNYYRSRNVAIRSKSRLGGGQFTDIQQLGKVVGFYLDEIPRSLSRAPEEDQVQDGSTLQAYVWNQESLGPIPDGWQSAEELWPERRVIFQLDSAGKLRRWRQQRGFAGRWKTYRTIDPDYPDSIETKRFAPEFGTGAQIVEAGSYDMRIDPEVASLVDQINRRHATYRDLEFQLEVTAEIKASAESQLPANARNSAHAMRTTYDRFALRAPEPNDDRLWRRWIQEQADESGARQLLRFAAFNGHESRRLRVDRRGQVLPGEVWTWFNENSFQELLFLGINGISTITPMSEDLRQMHLNRMHVVERTKTGRGEVVTILGASTPEFGMEYVVQMTTEPDYLILLWEARYALRNNQLVGRYAVTEIGEFQGVRYPAKGSYRQLAVRELPEVSYSFEVTGCRSLADEDRREWFPNWPAATVVQDRVRNEDYRTPD